MTHQSTGAPGTIAAWDAEAQSFPDQATERGADTPEDRQSIPAVAAADPVEIRLCADRRAGGSQHGDAHRVDAISEPGLPIQHLGVERSRLVVEGGGKGIEQADRFDPAYVSSVRDRSPTITSVTRLSTRV